MPIEHIVALLIAQRDRLTRAIEALQGPIKRRGRPPKHLAISAPVVTQTGTQKKSRKSMTPARRKAHSERMKKYWAERRKEIKKG